MKIPVLQACYTELSPAQGSRSVSMFLQSLPFFPFFFVLLGIFVGDGMSEYVQYRIGWPNQCVLVWIIHVVKQGGESNRKSDFRSYSTKKTTNVQYKSISKKLKHFLLFKTYLCDLKLPYLRTYVLVHFLLILTVIIIRCILHSNFTRCFPTIITVDGSILASVLVQKHIKHTRRKRMHRMQSTYGT